MNTDPKAGHRSPGIRFTTEGSAEICIWAPLRTNVSVLVNQQLEIQLKQENEYWWARTDEIVQGDLYKIRLDDKIDLPDPASIYQPQGVHGASQAISISYTWTDDHWKNPDLKDYIIYELHTGTFTPEGNFKGIERKLSYLKDLGITAIEIMPVSQFPGNRNWGYDGVFPYAAQNSYGGPSALQSLVDHCHRHGLAVILDVVYNHLGPEGNYLSAFAPYFTDKYKTPWGKALNFDDDFCDGVRHYFIENVVMWFRDFHIDALRMDAVHAIKDLSPRHILREIRDSVNQLTEITGRTHHLIIECDLNDTRYINPLEAGGYGMDAQWLDEFHHALRVAGGQERTGYYADFNGLEHLAKAYKDAYVYDGQYSPHRHRNFGVNTTNPGKQFIVFSQNHDQVGNRLLGERTSSLLSFDMCKLIAGCVFLSPYIPMIFMGEEFFETNPFLYFVSHSDPELVNAVREGRRAEFSAFHTQEPAPDPQSEQTFNASKLQWERLDLYPGATMLRYYRRLINLRKTHPVLNYPDRLQLDVQADEHRGILMLHRWHQKHHILALMNFSALPAKFLIPTLGQNWHVLLSSADPQWSGNAEAYGKITDQTEVDLWPESLLLLTNQ